MNRTIHRGDTDSWTINCTRDGQPVDLTGASITFAASPTPDGSDPVIERSTEDGGITISDAAGGICVLTFASVDTADLAAGNLYFTITVVEQDDRVTVVADGILTIIGSKALTFATADDLAVRLGLTFTDDEQDRAAALLAFATRLIQDAADGQTLFLVTDDTITMPGTNDEQIVLPQRPVVSVNSVILDGEALREGTDWYLDGNAIRRISNTRVYSAAALDSLVSPRYAGFGYPFQTLQITYSHGYAAIPELYRAICMEAVVRVWVNPGSVVQQSIGTEETTYAPYSAPPRGLMLTDSELKQIRKKKGARARGIWIG